MEMGVPMNIVVMVKGDLKESQLSQGTTKKLVTRMGTSVALQLMKVQWMRCSRSGRIQPSVPSTTMAKGHQKASLRWVKRRSGCACTTVKVVVNMGLPAGIFTTMT